MKAKTVSLDFDGVIHTYDKGWSDGTIYGDVVPGAEKYMDKLTADGNPTFILSTRTSKDILAWCEKKFSHLNFEIIPENQIFWNKKGVIGITNRKLAAHIYIDDRGYTFKGYFPDPDKFETYQERDKRRVVCPNKDANGNCPLHNIHCSYPDCEIKEL